MSTIEECSVCGAALVAGTDGHCPVCRAAPEERLDGAMDALDALAELEPPGFVELVVQVWFGFRPLDETYWKWGVLVYGLAVQVGLLTAAHGLSVLIHGPAPVVLALVFALLVRTWISVGLWRSAMTHPGLWAAFVKLQVVLLLPVEMVRALYLLSSAR